MSEFKLKSEKLPRVMDLEISGSITRSSFLDFNLNSFMTVELHRALSITPYPSVLTPRTTTTSTSEVTIGYTSSFKQKSGATVRLRVRYTLYPSIYVTYRYGMLARIQTFSAYVKEIHYGVHRCKESYSNRTGSSLYRVGSDVSESYLKTS